MPSKGKVPLPLAIGGLLLALCFAGFQILRSAPPGPDRIEAEVARGEERVEESVEPPPVSGEGRNPFRRATANRSVRAAIRVTPPLPTLEGIRGGARPAASLDGQLVGVGETVGSWTVDSIEGRAVRLRAPGGDVRILEVR